MSPFFAVFLVLLLGSSSYAAGRLHGQLTYRLGFRHGYRQGYFDGDRGAWNRRRREAQAALATVLSDAHPTPEPDITTVRPGTTYTSASFAGAPTDGGRHSAGARRLAGEPVG